MSSENYSRQGHHRIDGHTYRGEERADDQSRRRRGHRPCAPRHEEIRTPEALALLAEQHRAFDPRRRDLLDRRRRDAEPVAVADFRTVPASEPMP